MGSEFIDTFWNIRNTLACLGFLIGIGGGIFLITRRQTIPGVLAMVGFFLFSLEPLADIIVYRILYKQDLSPDMYTTFDYVYVCTSAAGFLLGSIAMVMALVNMMRSSQTPVEGPLETRP